MKKNIKGILVIVFVFFVGMFFVKADINDYTYEEIGEQTYTGKEVKPNVVIKMGENVLSKDTDYTLTYSNNIKVGNANINVVGSEGHSDLALTINFKISYKITYYLNGGVNNAANPIYYTKTVKLKNPTKAGYTSNGWYSDKKFKKKVTSVKKGNVKVYAKYTANKYNVKFNANGGKGKLADLKNKVYDKAFKLPANKFTRKGYKFVGWNTKKDGSGTTYKDKASVKKLTTKNKGTATLYAQWELIKYSIKYNLNGGVNNEANPSEYYVNSNNITLKNPTKEDNTFAGWYSDSKFKKKVTTITKGSTGNKTLYARWVKKIITSNATNVNFLSGQQSVVKIKESVSASISYNIADASIVTAKWGDWEGWKNGFNTCPLTLTAKNPGETTVTITNKYNNDKIVINVKVVAPWENTTLDISGPISTYINTSNTMDIKEHGFEPYNSLAYKLTVKAQYSGSTMLNWGGYLFCYDENDNYLNHGLLYFDSINKSGLSSGYMLCPINTRKIKDIYTTKSSAWDLNSLKSVYKFLDDAYDDLEESEDQSSSTMKTKARYALNQILLAKQIIDAKEESYYPSEMVINGMISNLGAEAAAQTVVICDNSTIKSNIETALDKIDDFLTSTLSTTFLESDRILAELYISRANTIVAAMELEFD